MEQRTVLLHLAKAQSLSSERFRALCDFVLPKPDPTISDWWLRRMLLLLTALCAGLALIFWIAANWDSWSTFARFTLAEGVLAASLLAGCPRSRLRPAALLLAMLALGGLLALYAQVYSNTADSWQLFALWALIAVPIVFTARHQVLWMPWFLVTLLACSFWLYQNNNDWEPSALKVICAWVILGLLSASLYPNGPLRKWLGASPRWAFRLATCCTLVFITFTAITKLDSAPGLGLLAIVIMVGVWHGLSKLRYADMAVFALCALCVDILIVALAIRALSPEVNSIGAWMAFTLILGIISLGVIAASIRLLRCQYTELHVASPAQHAAATENDTPVPSQKEQA